MRRRIKKQVDSISADRLHVAYDFLDYLQSREAEEATAELLAIPGFVEAVKKADADASTVHWRQVRSDV